MLHCYLWRERGTRMEIQRHLPLCSSARCECMHMHNFNIFFSKNSIIEAQIVFLLSPHLLSCCCYFSLFKFNFGAAAVFIWIFSAWKLLFSKSVIFPGASIHPSHRKSIQICFPAIRNTFEKKNNEEKKQMKRKNSKQHANWVGNSSLFLTCSAAGPFVGRGWTNRHMHTLFDVIHSVRMYRCRVVICKSAQPIHRTNTYKFIK